MVASEVETIVWSSAPRKETTRSDVTRRRRRDADRDMRGAPGRPGNRRDRMCRCGRCTERTGPADPDVRTIVPLWSHSDRSRDGEHTSELQSRQYLVCRLLLEKKKNKQKMQSHI